MNNAQYEDKPVGLKEKVVKAVGERLAKMAVSPRCQFLPIYESELSPEMIEEMIANQ